MSPGANELLFASGVAPACTPPGCWCFSPVVVAVVLVLLSSSSSSSVPEPSSDSANGVGSDSVCCSTVGYDACDVSDEPAACIISRLWRKPFLLKRLYTCVRLYDVTFRKTVVCSDHFDENIGDHFTALSEALVATTTHCNCKLYTLAYTG